MTARDIIFFIEGDCPYAPGPGGYGVIALYEEQVIYAHSRRYENTTLERVSLEAVLHIIRNFGDTRKVKTPVLIFVNIAYPQQVYSKYMNYWAKNNWEKQRGGTPDNVDLAKELYSLYNSGYRANMVHQREYFKTLGNKIAKSLAKGEITVKEVMEKYGNKK